MAIGGQQVLTSIIACSIVIVIISIVTEFRLGKLEKENAGIRLNVLKRNDTIKELADIADELINEGIIMVEVLEDNFTNDEINNMIANKKKQKEPKDINELIKTMQKENEHEHE